MNFFKSYLKSTAVFLLAGFSVLWVYAALSTVSSGDPLTASGWNEIVNKISNVNTNNDDLVTKSYVDSQISASSSGLSFAWYTTASYNGSMWGIKGMNEKCNAEYTGSRVCGYDDVVKLWVNYPWTENVWIPWAIMSSVQYYYESSNTTHYAKDGSDLTISHGRSPYCGTFNNNSSIFVWTLLNTSTAVSFPTCEKTNKLACCNW